MKTRVRADKSFHFVWVAGDDDDEPIAIVLHAFEERLDGFIAEILLGFGEAVGFVDEEHAVESAVDDGVGARGSLADVFRDERGAVALDQVAFAQNAERFIDASHEARDSRLAGAWVAGINGVITRRDGRETLGDTHLLD